MKGARTGSLAKNVAVFSAFLQAAGKTLISGMALTAAERQIEGLEEGRMRLWARHVRLHFDDAVVLGLDDLVADVQVDDPGLPLIPERTDQYAFHILKGTVRLSAATLEALLARYVLPSAGVPLSQPKVSLDERGMRLEAELAWGPLHVPVVLAGPMTVNEAQNLQFTVARVEAAGWGLGSLLSLLRTDIERVIQIEPGGPITARGNTLIIDPEQIFPAPRAQGRPVQVKAIEGALILDYQTSEPIVAPPLVEREAPAFLFCLGHTLLVGKMFLSDAVFQVVPRDEDVQDLDFSLQEYRRQLAAGESSLKQHGELLVRLPNLDQLDSQAYPKLNGRLAGTAQRPRLKVRKPG